MTTKDFAVKVVGFTVVAISLAVGLSYANCGNDDGNGNGCSGNTGTQGPQGPQGPAGPNGTNGRDGSNGTNGANGANGTNGKDGAPGPSSVDPRMNEAKLVADTAVRLYDGKYAQLQAFNVYAFGTHPGQDVFGDGNNQMYGVRVVLKLGKSYEERLLEKQALELRVLEARLSLLGAK